MSLSFLFVLLCLFVLVPASLCSSSSPPLPLDYAALTHEYVSVSSSSACPCVNVSLCAPVTVGDRPELFIFQVRFDDWLSYSWDALTTIVVTNTKVNSTMYCYAHARQVRIVYIADYPVNQLGNATNQQIWVAGLTQRVVDESADGINVDFESVIAASSPDIQHYTDLLHLLSTSIHSQCKSCQVTVDMAWSPNCIDTRCYDSLSISRVVDFMFIMSYDLRSQIYNMQDCIASANSPILRVIAGLNNYTQLGIPTNQLVLGVPWYCYDYPCLSGTDANATVCPIDPVPFRGAPCSDAAGTEKDFYVCMELLRQSNTGRRWNEQFQTPNFNYVDNRGRVHQVWFDDPESLSYKYALVADMKLRGVGMWAADFLNYSNPAPPITVRMWDEINNAIRRDEQQNILKEE